MRRLLTIIISLLSLIAEAQLLHFHQLTVKDGLPVNSIIALGEDAKGNIWVATPSGLCYYDGEHFYPITTNQLPEKRIDRINRDDSGTMWVQCFERHQEVSCYDTLTQRFITYNVKELSDSVKKQAVKPLNRTFDDPRSTRTWTVNKRMLWQKDKQNANKDFAYCEQTAIDAELKDETIFSLLLDSKGILWAGSANDGLFFADTRVSNYHRLICQPNPLVRSVCKDSGGILWIATGNKGLFAVFPESNNYLTVDYPLTDSIEGRRIRPIIEDSKGRLWLGTFDGLYIKEVESNIFRKMAFADTLTHAIYALCEDDKKQLWIGTEKGLYRLNLDEKKLQPQLIDSTLTHIIDMSIGKDYCWIATNHNLIRWTENDYTPWLDAEAHCVITDALGQTWVGTDSGLCKASDQGLQTFPSPADEHIVKDLLVWRDFLWVCYDQGICCINIYNGSATRLRTLHNEYMEGAAHLDASTATLYFGGSEGIDCFKADSIDEQLRSGQRQLWLNEIREELMQKEEESSSVSWWIIVTVCLAVIVIVVLLTIKKNDKPQPIQAETPAAPSPFVEKATAIVNAHMSDTDFTAEQLAQEMAMSRTKLFVLMKKETGKAAMEFVRDIRLEYAAEQLKKGMSIAEITLACGFSDPSSFRRSFSKKFGVNPSQFVRYAK